MFFQALILSAALEAGLVSGGYYNYTKPTQWESIGALYTSLEADVHYGAFYLGGEMDCYFTPQTIANYYPFQMTFIARGGFDFGNFSLNIERSCFHPMNVYYTIIGNEIKPKYEGGMWKIFLRLETK